MKGLLSSARIKKDGERLMAEQENQTENLTFSLSSERLNEEQLLDLLDGLRRDLAELPEVKKVQSPKGDGVKEGSKGIEVELLNTVVTLSTAAGGGIVALLAAWLSRNRRVEVEFAEGNSYGLKKVSAASLQQFEAVLKTSKSN